MSGADAVVRVVTLRAVKRAGRLWSAGEQLDVRQAELEQHPELYAAVEVDSAEQEQAS